MKIPVRYPDAERLTRDLLAVLIASVEPDVTVGIGLPDDWTPESPEHLQVAANGTPTLSHPCVAHPTVRLTAWAASTTRAKHLAATALGLLSAHAGGDGISTIRPLTGPVPVRDPVTRADLAYVTLRVTTRSTPI